MANIGFPVTVLNEEIAVRLRGSLQSIDSYIRREYIYHGMEMSGTVIVPTTGSVGITTVTLVPTECFIPAGATFAVAGGRATAQLQYMAGPFNPNPASGTSATSHRLPLLNATGNINLTGTVFTPGSNIPFTLRNGDGVSQIEATCNIAGARMTADLNFGAEKVILWMGDSVTRGSAMGGNAYADWNNILTAVSPSDHFAFQVRDYFRDLGIDCRLVIKAMGSYTSRMLGYWLRNGWADIDQADIIFWQPGINDATVGTTDAQWHEEINRVIVWRNRRFPKAPLVLVGPTPLNNGTAENRLATLRGIKATYANAQANIYYLSLGSAFDRTVLSNYTGNDGTHPNIATNLLVGNAIKSWVNANNFRF